MKISHPTAPLFSLALLLFAVPVGAQPDAADAPGADPPVAQPAVQPAVAERALPVRRVAPLEPVRVHIVGARHRQIRMADERPTVEFPIEVTRPPGQLQVTFLEVTWGNPPLAADGVFSGQAADGGSGWRLRLQGEPERLRVGTYALTVQITGEGVDDIETTLQVTVPAPDLAYPPRLSVQRVRPLFGLLGAGDASTEPLLIREKGRLSGLTEIRLTQLGPLSHDGGETVGTIEQVQAAEGSPLDRLEPGGVVTIPYRVTPRQLPAGVTSGRILLSARELPEPIEIPVSISTKVDPVWIIFLVFLGVLFGLFSREVLGRWQARTEALALAEDERIELGRARAQAVEKGYRDALDKALADLEQAQLKPDPEKIADAVAASRKVRRAAVEALTKRHKALAKEYEKARKVLGQPLPPGLSDPIASRLDQAREALAASQIDDAAAVLESVQQGEGLTELRASLADWQIRARQALGSVSRLGDLAEIDAKAALKDLEKVEAEGAYAKVFGYASGAYAELHQLVGEVWVAVDDGVEEVLLNISDAADPRALARVRGIIGEARQTLVEARSPIEALRMLTGELLTALSNALLAARPGDDTRRLLAERQYRAAAALAVTAETPESDLGDPAMGVGEVPAPPARARPAADSPPGPAAEGTDEAAVPALQLAAPTGVTPRRVPDPWVPRLVNSAVNAVVISLIAYLTYADDFVGDGKQVIATLLWAYGLDLGTEAVKKQLSRVKPTG